MFPDGVQDSFSLILEAGILMVLNVRKVRFKPVSRLIYCCFYKSKAVQF